VPAPALFALVVAALAAGMAAATALAGWWGVPLVAALAALVPAGAARPRGAATRRWVTPGRAALAGALAWGAFLAAAAAGGRLGPVSTLVGRVVGAPAPAVLALTLALPAMLAWAAAALAAGVVGARRPPAPDPITLPAPGQPSRPAGSATASAAESAPGSTAAATP
jgi:hypothetical protein